MTDALWPNAAVVQHHYNKDWTRHPVYIMDRTGTHPLYQRNATRPPYNSDGAHPLYNRKPVPQQRSVPSELYQAIAHQRGYPDRYGALPYHQNTTPPRHQLRQRRPAPRATGHCPVTYPHSPRPAVSPSRTRSFTARTPETLPEKGSATPRHPESRHVTGVQARQTRTSQSHARPEQQQTVPAQHVESPGRPSPSRPVPDAAPPPPPNPRAVTGPVPDATVPPRGEFLMSRFAADTVAPRRSAQQPVTSARHPGPASAPAPAKTREPETVSLLNPTGRFAEKVAAVARLREFDESIPHDHLPRRRLARRKPRRLLPRLVMLVRCKECEQPWPCHPLRTNLHRTHGDNITAKIKELSTKKNRAKAGRRSPTATHHRAWTPKTWNGKPKPD